MTYTLLPPNDPRVLSGIAEFNIDIFKEDDPKELYIPINELIYSLTEKNIIDVYFWYEWIIEYENICKKKRLFLS